MFSTTTESIISLIMDFADKNYKLKHTGEVERHLTRPMRMDHVNHSMDAFISSLHRDMRSFDSSAKPVFAFVGNKIIQELHIIQYRFTVDQRGFINAARGNPQDTFFLDECEDRNYKLQQRLLEFMGDQKYYDKDQILSALAERLSHLERNQSYEVIQKILSRVSAVIYQPEEDLAPVSIPEKASVFWKGNRLPDDNPAIFIMRNYGDFVSKGLNKGHIKQLDPTLYMALYRWEQDDDREIPPGFVLPGRESVVESLLADPTEEELKHAQRVIARRQRQRQKDAEK